MHHGHGMNSDFGSYVWFGKLFICSYMTVSAHIRMCMIDFELSHTLKLPVVSMNVFYYH